MVDAIERCRNVGDFRELARRRLPGPIFHCIDGAADDEVTYRRNTAAFDDCDLVPNVLAGVADVDMSVDVMGRRLGLPIFCSPTALQRLFHHDGELALTRWPLPSTRSSAATASATSSRDSRRRPG